MMAKWYVHVNQHKIRKNIHVSESQLEPVIAVHKGKTGAPKYGFAVRIPDGSRMVYDPRAPLLACGARLVIECDEEPVIETT